ncbi:MAG: lamin tail domain-containing protein, partial [Candidatus Nealsonbacteria bacterium]|nr:lamin tail domain-containing protein [Candidatus Nealsonbacteria bacterium]
AGDLPLRFRVFINEVGWAGTDNSASDEWIELRNIWGIPVNLEGWQLLDKDGQIKIVFQESDIIQPNDYYLLERTDDDSIPGVPADLIYSGALNNSNEALYLFDNNCELEDEVAASPDWPAGDNSQKKAMERLDNLYWYTYHGSAQGTPGTENSSPPRESSNTSPVLEEEEEQPAVSHILITEVQIENSSSTNYDFIELYNPNGQSIDISGFQLKKKSSTGNEYSIRVFPEGTVIGGQAYFLWMNSGYASSSVILANSTSTQTLAGNNSIVLLDRDKNSFDSLAWGSSSSPFIEGQAFPENPNAGENLGRKWSSGSQGYIDTNNNQEDFELQAPTPKAKNSVSMSFTEISGTLSLEEDLVLTLLGSPYVIEGSITVNEGVKLTIEAGVIIKFKHNSNWHSALNVMGELEAIGGENLEQKIIFTSIYDDEYGGDTNNDGVTSQPAVGDWEWLYLNDAQSVLENVVIRYAGKKLGGPPMAPYYTKGAVYIDGGQTLIENSIIEKSQTLGIWLNNSSSTSITTTEFNEINTSWSKPAAIYIESSSPTISSSTFNGNNIGILVEGVAGPVIENNTFEANYIPIQINNLLAFISNNILQNNNYNGIYLTGLNYPDGQTSITWRKTNNPYVVETLSLPAGLDFNIEPGVIIKFLYQKRLNIEANFRAEGTESEKIIFTSIQDDEYGGDTNNDGAVTQPGAGSWHYIYFSSSSTSPVLDNVIVRYGGWQNTFLGGVNAKSGAIKTDGAPLTIKNSVIENNLYAGVELISSVSQIENTIFRDHRATYNYGSGSSALYMDNSTTTFSNAVFNNNYYGIYIIGNCPDLSGVSFGEGDDANSKKTFPMSCPL